MTSSTNTDEPATIVILTARNRAGAFDETGSPYVDYQRITDRIITNEEQLLILTEVNLFHSIIRLEQTNASLEILLLGGQLTSFNLVALYTDE